MLKKPETGDLRSLLGQRLGISDRQLYRRANELADRASLTVAEAIWVLAAQDGVNLRKYLPQEVVDRVRGLLLQIPSPPKNKVRESNNKSNSAPAKQASRELVIARGFRGEDPILTTQVLGEAKDMASVYPLLYIIENSMREFIRRIVDARSGRAWWTTQSPTGVRNQIARRMADEERNAWHQRRGEHPIDYLDLNELPKVVRALEPEFVTAFMPSLQWFEQFVAELYESRCVVCHMNPLHADNIADVKLRVKKWQRLAKEKKDALP